MSKTEAFVPTEPGYYWWQADAVKSPMIIKMRIGSDGKRNYVTSAKVEATEEYLLDVGTFHPTPIEKPEGF